MAKGQHLAQYKHYTWHKDFLKKQFFNFYIWPVFLHILNRMWVCAISETISAGYIIVQ